MGLRALGLARAYDEDQHDGVYRLLFFKLNWQSKSTESDHIIRTPLLVRKLAAITATRLWRSIRPAQPRGLLTSSRHCAQSCTGTKHRSTKTHAPHPANKKKTVLMRTRLRLLVVGRVMFAGCRCRRGM
jgi:hypothetical protein